tara:strand:+ start:433 stop:1329 length:897 start_codon:yes stop_codon:yes gene_type:complete
MTTLSTYGALTTKSLKCETDLTFQTANSNSTVLRATDGSGDQIITIAAQSGNSTLLTTESSVAAAKVDINGASAETSLQDADTFLFYDNSAAANKKVTGANLKTYVGASGQTSGTSGQIIVFNGANAQAAVNMSGDVAIDNAGATTIQSGSVETAMLADDSVSAAKLADNAVVNASVDASAAIAYSKLNLSNSIVAGDLATDSVETVKIANNAVTNPKIAGLSGVTAGTVTALKLMLPDASKDLSGFRNLTSTGDNQSASVLIGTSEWKIVNSGTDLLFQKWNSGTSAWVTKSTISGA